MTVFVKNPYLCNMCARYEGIKKVIFKDLVLTFKSRQGEVFKFDKPHLFEVELEEDDE